jgi:hypothetical protein
MSESTRALIVLILTVILLLAIAFAASNWMMRRAIKKVIKMLRDGQALSSETARTTEQLGFKQRQMLQFKLWRDYTPAALQILMTANIIQSTEDGRLFLSEDNLSKTPLGKQAG